MITTEYLTTQKEKRKERKAWAVFAIEAALVIALAVFTILTLTDIGLAEKSEGQPCWVLCRPDSCVNLRETPKKNGAVFGGSMAGAVMKTDGKERNGFLRVYDLPAEETEGWISTRYIVYDEPVRIGCPLRVQAEGRVACRKWIGGKVIRWAYDGDSVLVYLMSGEWCVTEWGYIRTEFLEVPQG